MDRYNEFTCMQFDRPAPHVLRITLDRPEKLNAINRTLHGELERIWSIIDADPDVRCSIITGNGRAFSVGGDASDLGEVEGRDPAAGFNADFRSAAALVMNIIDAKKPIVSAINGPAVGAGLAIGLLADIPIAAAEATLVEGHVRMTKHVLNRWLRQARPVFELSLAFELSQMNGAEAAEAMSAFIERRTACFPEDSDF